MCTTPHSCLKERYKMGRKITLFYTLYLALALFTFAKAFGVHAMLNSILLSVGIMLYVYNLLYNISEDDE